MKSLNVRSAGPADASALARLAEATFRGTFAAENNAGDMDLHCRKPYGPEIQLQEITDAGLVTLLADIDGELAGFAQLRLRAPQPCIPATNPMELSRLYVAKSWHGCGVAQRLMHRVLETVQSQRCTDLWLGVWERNARALAFYRKFGFTMVGEHVFTVGTDPQRDLILHFRP